MIAMELNKKAEAVQVATLLTVIDEKAREVFAMFRWDEDEDQAKIGKVVDKFKTYCQPRKNISFERHRFNQRSQEPGELCDQYRTALRLLAESCESRQMKSSKIGWYLGSEMTKLESAYSEKRSLPWQKQTRSVVQQRV